MREMKDSGIEWIGGIPADWKLKRIKTLFLERKEKNDPVQTDFILSLGAAYGVVPYLEKEGGGNKAKEDLSDYRLAHPNDIIMNSMNIISGAVGLSKYFGCVSPVYYMLYPRQDNVDPVFYCYMFQTKAFQRSLLGLGNGILIKESSSGNFNTVRMRIPMEKLGVQLLPLPSIDEQKKITEMLDRICADVDAVIEKTKNTIEEYKKLKQSIITEAVTKGIRGDRPMKDSGIAWVPKIAADWHISRIGLHYDVILGKMLCDRQLQDDYTLEDYFCAANVHFDGVATQGLKKMWFSPAERETYRVNIGDLLVVEGGAGAGGAAIVTELINPTYIQNSIMIVRGKHSQTNRYLRYWIECLVKKGYVDVVCNKATIPHFTKDKLATMPIPVLDETEMLEIADYLDVKCSQLDTLIARKTSLLEEMESYKKSVIYEYVTGKKEV